MQTLQSARISAKLGELVTELGTQTPKRKEEPETVLIRGTEPLRISQGDLAKLEPPAWG